MQTNLRRWMTLVQRPDRLDEGVLSETVLKAATRELLRAVSTGFESTEAVIYEMYRDGYVESPDESEERKRGFRTKLRNWCAGTVSDMARTLTNKFQSDKLPIWRMITAPADWQPDPSQHPGLFWSWDCNAAEAHWGNFSNGNVNWLLYAEAVSGQINWPMTLAKNCTPDYANEKEIELKQAPIKIISYERKTIRSCSR